MQLSFKKMRKIIVISLLLCSAILFSQEEKKKDSITTYKKRVLESTEIDFLMSYYNQDGDHASVTGGIGTEELTDITPTIIVALPLNDDDVLTVDVGISAYTSASSSNLDPFDGVKSGASGGGNTGGSPWVESSGASQKDTWFSTNVNYEHSSDDRNSIWSANVGFASEYDYTSIGFGGGFTKLFNEKNTEIGVKAQVYLDTWNPKYPTELDSYIQAGSDINSGYFSNVDIRDEGGNIIDKNGFFIWQPDFQLITDETRNSYSGSLSFSQIINKKSQISLFLDVVHQKGLLSNPMQRVYFSDKQNYYIGEPEGIPNYDTPSNVNVFQLADDIERLPNTRFKIPIGMRYNYYINETFSLRTYYRFYHDDWGINSHTASVELPIKVSDKFTLYPTYRYYQQTKADYFAPYEANLSTQEFYTSDYDLSKFDSNQYGLGIKYSDALHKKNIFTFGIKSVDLRYNNYTRSDGLNSGIISFGIKFVN